ncbi:hypothetical protein EMCRGX_G027023 [Ephydatia muelleri]
MPGPVTRLTWTSGQNYVYAITSTSVVQVLIEQCSSFTGCLSCAANVNSLSGWRTVEQKCSRRSQCQNSTVSSRWVQGNTSHCPSNTIVTPTTFTLERPTNVRDQNMMSNKNIFTIITIPGTGNGVPISAPSSQVNQTTGAISQLNTPKGYVPRCAYDDHVIQWHLSVVNIGFGSSLLNIPFATSRLTTYNCAAATSAGSSARVPPSKLEQKNIKLEQRNRELNAIIQEMRQEMEQCVNADPAGIADGQLMVKDVLSRVSDAPYSAEYVCYLERELAEMKAEKRKIAKRLDELVAH